MSRCRDIWFGPINWLCLAIAAPALADRTVLVNEIGVPSTSSLFIANADGSNEHALLLDANMDYDASFSADGQWIVFTSERRGRQNFSACDATAPGLNNSPTATVSMIKPHSLQTAG